MKVFSLNSFLLYGIGASLSKPHINSIALHEILKLHTTVSVTLCTYGSVVYYYILMQNTVKEYIEVSHDQLPKLMEFFHDLLTAGSGPSVIFSHCEVRDT